MNLNNKKAAMRLFYYSVYNYLNFLTLTIGRSE